MFVAGLGICLAAIATRHAVGVHPDSGTYLGAAHNLLHGRGLTSPFNLPDQYGPARAASFNGAVPLTHFPPLFPATLGLVAWLGPSIPTAARVLNALLLGVNLFLVGLLFVRLTHIRAWPVACAVMALVLVGPVEPALTADLRPNWLFVHSTALSEPLFICWSLAGLLLLHRHLTEGSRFALYAAALCCGLAVSTRYVGLSLLVTGAVAVGVLGAGNVRRRWRNTAVFTAIGLAPIVGWTLFTSLVEYGGVSRVLRYHPKGLRLTRIFDTIEAWLMPASWPRHFREVVLGFVVIAAIAFVTVGEKRRGESGGSSVLFSLLCLFAVAYTATLVLARLFFDASIPFDSRILGPLQPVVYVLLLSVVWKALRHRLRDWQVAACCIVLCVLPSIGSVHGTATFVGHGVAPTKRSPTLSGVAELPVSTLIATNVPEAVYLGDGRASIAVPRRVDLRTGEVNRSFIYQLHELCRVLVRRQGVIVMMPTLSGRLFTPVTHDLRREMPLRRVGRFEDGGEILAVPRSEQYC